MKRSLAYAWLALWALLCLAWHALAAPQDAVVRIGSHGCSGTVVHTAQGRSLILTCAHAFRGASRAKRIVVNAPHPRPGGVAVSALPRLVAVDHAADLAMVELRVGPLPYVLPVAGGAARPAKCLSVGYDEMRLPATVRWAHVTGSPSYGWTYTRERPWHGRSGGALICEQSQQLVGVVSGYTGPQTRQEVRPGASGVYVSLRAVRAFVGRHAPEALGEALPAWPEYRSPAPPPYAVPFAAPPSCAPGGG